MPDGNFTFTPQFKEFLPLYRDVTRVWIGSSANNEKEGMLYAEYANGSSSELGYITLYPLAVENGYTGTDTEWMQGIISLIATNKGASVTLRYQNSTNGTTHPSASSGWTTTPSPQQGKYLWTKVTLTWADQTTSDVYLVSYQGSDSSIVSVNGMTGTVVLHGENVKISANSNTTLKSYIDSKASDVVSVNNLTGAVVLHGENVKIDSSSNKTVKAYIDEFQPDFASDSEIDALFE